MPPVPPTERETFRNRLRWRASPPATGGWAIDQEAPTDALTSWPALTYSARFGSGASNQAFGGANAVGSLSPKAVTISLLLTSSATPFCCADAYWYASVSHAATFGSLVAATAEVARPGTFVLAPRTRPQTQAR